MNQELSHKCLVSMIRVYKGSWRGRLSPTMDWIHFWFLVETLIDRRRCKKNSIYVKAYLKKNKWTLGYQLMQHLFQLNTSYLSDIKTIVRKGIL